MTRFLKLFLLERAAAFSLKVIVCNNKAKEENVLFKHQINVAMQARNRNYTQTSKSDQKSVQVCNTTDFQCK